MTSNVDHRRNLLRATAAWWEADRNRLRLIRGLAYALFVASVVGTIYSGIKGALPVWAITLYTAFAVQLVFMTFMYAIRHSGAEEIRHSLFRLRRDRIAEWRFERDMLTEFTRFAFCTAHGLDPQASHSAGQHRGLHARRRPWPEIDLTTEVCAHVREGLAAKTANIVDAAGRDAAPGDDDRTLTLDFLAYSSETLINLSRDICDEVEEYVQTVPGGFSGHVAVRILVRDTTDSGDWLVPLALQEEHDRQYASDLRTRFRNVQRSALREFHESLKEILTPRQVEFRVRGYRAEPIIKGVLVDASKGVFGLYGVDSLKDPEGWDYSGHAVAVCPCDITGTFVPATAAAFFQRWFAELWSHQLSSSIEW